MVKSKSTSRRPTRRKIYVLVRLVVMFARKLKSGSNCRHVSGSTLGVARVIVKDEDLTVSHVPSQA